MATITGRTRDGREWIPQFIEKIEYEKCIGCGRCFKVCVRGVLNPIEKPFEGDDEYGDDMGNKVMSISTPGNCIGCSACSRVCTKKCQVFVEI